MAIVIFALSLTIYEIFAIHIKCQKFDRENEGKDHGVEKQELRRSTENVRFYIVDFFSQNFSYLITYVYTQTHILTNTHRARRVMTIDKICNADLPNNDVRDRCENQ